VPYHIKTFEPLYAFLLMYLHHPQATVSSVVFGSYTIEGRGWNGSGHSDARWPFMRMTERAGGSGCKSADELCFMDVNTNLLALLVFVLARVCTRLCSEVSLHRIR